MLDAFIIEELRRREREQQDDRRPVLELPLDNEPPPKNNESRDVEIDDEDVNERGVVIIDM